MNIIQRIKQYKIGHVRFLIQYSINNYEPLYTCFPDNLVNYYFYQIYYLNE
jgi:hypothetical protein